MGQHDIAKVVTVSLLGGAMYWAATCPCEVYLECHKHYYWMLLAGAAAMAFEPVSQSFQALQ